MDRKLSTPAPYSAYQLQLYERGIRDGIVPPITTDHNKLAAEAKNAMRPEAYGYVAGGAGEGATMDANRQAFREWRIVPRMLRPTVPRDLTVEIFGERHPSPFLVAPVGVQGIFHEDKELGTASAAAELGVPFIMSTAATSMIQEVAQSYNSSRATNPYQPPTPSPWFQLYWPMDDEITGSILRTAKSAGFKVLVVTLDTATMSWRPTDLDRSFLPFAWGEGNQVGYSDPVFRRKLAERHGGGGQHAVTPESHPSQAAAYWIGEAFPGESHAWSDLALLRRHWGSDPIVLKGIQDPHDAVRALEHGMDGIIVSNHGGRQCDGAAASLDMLAPVVEAVGGKIPVLFDSGVRTAADAVKALSLGATAVCVGRPVIYGLGIGGREGARHVLASLLAELDGTLGLVGVKSVKELGRGNLQRAGGEERSVWHGGTAKSRKQGSGSSVSEPSDLFRFFLLFVYLAIGMSIGVFFKWSDGK